MSSRKRRSSGGNPAKRRRPKEVEDRTPWEPLEPGFINPDYIALSLASGAAPPAGVFANNLYQVSVYIVGDKPPGEAPIHLSIKRHDRAPVHDWRHLQAIKNEICGAEAMAVEIYPPESQLVDTSNQYHLWVLPPKVRLPFGFDEFLVSSDIQVDLFNAGSDRGEHKGRQRPWQPGLPTALGRNEQPDADRDMMEKATNGMRARTP